MSNNLWKKFDDAIDTDALAKETKEYEENGGSGNFEPVPFGTYEVSVEKLELTQSKKGDPIVTAWFKVLDEGSKHKGSLIFYNQVINQNFQVHLANELLRSFGVIDDIDFVSYSQYGELLMDVFEAINGNFEYALKYSEGKNGFAKYEITEIFELED